MTKEKQQGTQEEQELFTCSGDCMECSMGQRQYCAAQNAYYAMRLVQQVSAHIADMREAIKTLGAKIDAVEQTQRSTGTAHRVGPQDS